MEITSKTLGISYPTVELSQGLAEKLVEKMADKSGHDGIVYQREYVEAAREIGWIECPLPEELPRRVVKYLFVKLSKIWEDANEIPND